MRVTGDGVDLFGLICLFAIWVLTGLRGAESSTSAILRAQ
jgi:hypothetical protein